MWMLNGQVPIQAIKSTTAYCTPIGGNLVLWKVKIRIVAQSSYEVEYQAMAHGTCELLWLHIFARVVNRIERSGPMTFHFDDTAAHPILLLWMQEAHRGRLSLHRRKSPKNGNTVGTYWYWRSDCRFSQRQRLRSNYVMSSPNWA